MSEMGIVIVCFSIWVGIFFVQRILHVHTYRKGLYRETRAAAMESFDRGLEWEWRFQKYNEVTFLEMVFKFWKPITGFYKEFYFAEFR